ncbi:MAG: exosortase/archaeosortase family protein [Gemmatales bacterium]
MSQAQGRALGSWLTGRTLVLISLVCLVAYPTIKTLVLSWERNPDYAHGWLLAPACIYLLLRRQPWQLASTPQPALGGIAILAGGLIHLATLVVPWPLLDYAGWVLMLRGVMLATWGRIAANSILPLLALGIMLFPVPLSWLSSLAMTLQDVIAALAEVVLNLVVVCHRRGHLLYLAGMDEPLSVAVECSGVRQLLVFVSLAWCMTFFLHGATWRKVVLVAASVPLAIAANVARVLTLALLARWLGPASIQGMLHDAPLLLTLPIGGLCLWLLYSNLQIAGKCLSETSIVSKPAPILIPAVALTMLLVLQFFLQKHLAAGFQYHQAARPALDELPWQLGRWKGMSHPEEAQVKHKANEFADATLLRTYASGSQAAAVYLVYSATGRDRLHHPDICLRDAGGARALTSTSGPVPLPGEGRRAYRLRYEKAGPLQTTIYYWHYTLYPARSLEQSLLQRLYFAQYDQWPSVTVQVQTNMTDPRTWQNLEATLLPEVDRWLQNQLPTGTQVGCERLPIRFLR